MLAGHNSEQFLLDMKYNATNETFEKIVKTKKALSSEFKRMVNEEKSTGVSNPKKHAYNYMANYLDEAMLPGIYNSVNGYDIQSSFQKGIDGVDNDTLLEMAKMAETIAEYAKYEEGTILDKTVNALYDQFCSGITEDPTEQEMQQEEEKISKMTKSIEDSKEPPASNEENPLKNLDGYKKLEEWLKNMKGDASVKKKMQQIQKMSDLQKVSPVEFAKPKALLFKKIINKELYSKQVVPTERFMHIIIDKSGSMNSYNKWRNVLISRVYDDCVKMNINVETGFWNTHIYTQGIYGPKRIHSKEELRKKTLEIHPEGDDRMGYCTLQKLESMQKKKNKQYVLVISDGTGSIDDRDQRKRLYELGQSKNIEFKFALFSEENDMCGTKTEDIFYIYK